MFDILLAIIEIAGGIILAVLFFRFFETILKIFVFIFFCGLILTILFGILFVFLYSLDYFNGSHIIDYIFNYFFTILAFLLELTAKQLGLIILSIFGFWLYIKLGSSFCYWIEGLFEKKNK